MPAKIAEGREADIFAWDAGTVLRLYRDPAAGPLADREMAALAAVRSVMPHVLTRTARIVHDGRSRVVDRLADRIPDERAPLLRAARRLVHRH
jgi:hypothetical protein